MAYGDGEAYGNVVEHVEGCPTCTERAAGYTQMQSELRRSLYRFDCPDAHTLGEYELGLLQPEQGISIARHTLGCAECTSDLRTLRAFMAAPTHASESLVEHARRVVARLLTPAPGLAYGNLRGSSAESTTRVYEVDDITVTIGAGQASGTLIGLVMAVHSPPEELHRRQVRLIPRSGMALVSTLDEIGNFEFGGVTPGAYALEVDLPDGVVVVEELQVR